MIIEPISINEDLNFVVGDSELSEEIAVVPLEARFVNDNTLVALVFVPKVEKFAVMQLGTVITETTSTYNLIHNINNLCMLKVSKIKIVNQADELVEEYVSCLFTYSLVNLIFIPHKESAIDYFNKLEFEV